jgi:hypothetical protein
MTALRVVRFSAVIFVLVGAAASCNDRPQRLALGEGAPKGARIEGDSFFWKSEFFPAKFSWEPPWRYMKTTDAIDSPKRLRAPFRDPESASFLVAEITLDVPDEQLSESEYLSAVKKQQLQAKGMEFIDQGPAKLFGIDFHRLRFSNDGERGPRAVHAFLRRDGKTSVVMQAIFPVSKREDAKVELPDQFNLLNINVELKD